MAGNRGREMLGPMLATIIVLFYGGIATAIVLAAGGGDPVIGLLIFLALSGITLFSGFLLRSTNGVKFSSFDWFRRRPAVSTHDYQPLVRERAQRQLYGTNRPPSVDEIREQRDLPSNWVPNQDRRSRRNHPGQKEKG